MGLPLPYEAALLREHAYYDTNLIEYVVTPIASSTEFHRISERGLGLFNYRFDNEIIYPKGSFDIALNWLSFTFILMVGFGLVVFHRLQKQRGSKLQSLSSPIVFQTSSFATDIEKYAFDEIPDLTNSPIQSDCENEDLSITPKSYIFSNFKHLNFQEIAL